MLSCIDIAPWLNTHSPTACGGKVVAPATKGGMHFQRPQGGCPVFAAKGGIYTGAPKGAHLASAAILYTFRGRSPQPVREASAGPGQNPWRPGPKARRRHQPSPAKAGVNLREYSFPPILHENPWFGAKRMTHRTRAPQASEPSFRNSARHLTASGQRLLSHFPNFSSKASFSASSLVFPSFMKRRISFSIAS